MVIGVKQGIMILEGAIFKKLCKVERYMGSGPSVKQPGGIGPVYSGKKMLKNLAMRRSLRLIEE